MDDNKPVYVGDKSRCDSCKKIFIINEPVFVDEGKDLVFCHLDPAGSSCLVSWVFLMGEMVNATTMRYRGNT